MSDPKRTVLMVWELGANLGHIHPLLALAKPLREQGHRVVFAVKDIQAAASLLEQHGFSYSQAPLVPKRVRRASSPPVSYAEILLLNGYGDAAALTATVLAWRKLYSVINPDVIVFDHSPVALLAARETHRRLVVIGTGFTVPPHVSPMPSFRPWTSVPPHRLATSDQRALENANAALRAIGSKAIGALYELFDTDDLLLATIPELDNYERSTSTRYWGPLKGSGGEAPSWPDGEGKKLFVYIRPGTAAFHPLTEALRSSNHRTLWFTGGIGPSDITQLSTAHLRFMSEPLDIEQTASSADAAIFHAGHGTTAVMLLSGVPMLLFPQYVEQLLVARRAAALGVASAVAPQALVNSLRPLATWFGNEGLRERAKRFATARRILDARKHLINVIAGNGEAFVRHSSHYEQTAIGQ